MRKTIFHLSRRVTLFIAILILFYPLNIYSEIIERIVAIVNDDIITLSELRIASSAILENFETRNPGRRDRILLESEVLDRLIEDRLIRQAAERMGILPAQREIDKAIEEVKKNNNIDQETLLKALSANGISYSDYREKIKQDIIQMKFLNKVVRPKIAISEEEIGDFYNKNKGLFANPLEVRLQQILFLFPADASSIEKARLRQRALNVLKRIRKGEDFISLAIESFPGQADKSDFDLGYIKKGEIDHSLEKVAFKLKVGEVSDLIESEVGFHILRVVDRKGGDVTPLSQVKEKVRDLLFEKKTEEAFKEWLEDARKTSYIEVRL